MSEGHHCSARVLWSFTVPDEGKLTLQAKGTALQIHFLNVKPLLAQLLKIRLNMEKLGILGYTCDLCTHEPRGEGGDMMRIPSSRLAWAT